MAVEGGGLTQIDPAVTETSDKHNKKSKVSNDSDSDAIEDLVKTKGGDTSGAGNNDNDNDNDNDNQKDSNDNDDGDNETQKITEADV